jgi:hypothetical protein
MADGGFDEERESIMDAIERAATQRENELK